MPHAIAFLPSRADAHETEAGGEQSGAAPDSGLSRLDQTDDVLQTPVLPSSARSSPKYGGSRLRNE